MMLCWIIQQKYLKMPGNKPESYFVKRVNTPEGCWHHSQQDHNPSLTLSNQMKWRDVTPLPPDSLSGNDIERCPSKKLNLVLSNESTPENDVGIAVNKTTITV
jgi:hypothetical protein